MYRGLDRTSIRLHRFSRLRFGDLPQRWCFEPDGSFNVPRRASWLGNIARRDRLDAAELAALPLLARGSALRFLLTRLYDWLNQTAGALVRPRIRSNI